MPIGPYLGALGAGIAQGEHTGYEQSLDQASTAAAGQGLQLLQALSMQPPMPPQQQGGPPGMPPQGGMQPPMGGMAPQGAPPPMGGAPPMPQGGPPMGGMPPGGSMGAPAPQPPQRGPMGQPGQMPMQPPPPQGQPPPMQQGFGQQPQQGSGLDWRTLIMAIQRGNPGAPPQVLFGAVNKLVPLMNSQSQLEWRHLQAQTAQDRVAVTARGQDIRADTAERGQDVRAETAAGAQETARRGQDVRAETAKAGQQQKAEQFNIREARITAHQMITSDQAWQRLDQQRKALQARVQQGGEKQALAQWRATLDAQHKKAQEIISAYSINANMPKEKRDALLKESDEAYERAIKEIGKGDKESFDSRFQGGGQSTP